MNEQRKKVCLNGYWEFSCSTDSFDELPEKWEDTKILVPSPYNINSFAHGYPKTTAGEDYYVSGGDFRLFPEYPLHWDDTKLGFYKRSIFIPEDSRGKRIFLVFEAVAYKSVYYINGKRIATEVEAFLPIEIEITDFVHYDAENELIVGAQPAQIAHYNDEDGRKRTDYPQGSFWGEHIAGIWQDVWLCERPVGYIKDVFVVTDVYKKTLTIRYDYCGEGLDIKFSLSRWGMKDEEEYELQTENMNNEAVWLYNEGDVELWDIDNPALYMLHANLYKNGFLVDRKSTRIGFRTFTAEGSGFMLNGRPIKLTNDSWHYMGFSIQTEEYARSYYKMAKDANVNIIRLHAQPFPSFFYDIADEMGMLLVSESAVWASHCIFSYSPVFFKNSVEHLKRLIIRDRNHPSVVMWSPENECIPAYKVCGSPYIKNVADLEDKLYELTQVIPMLDHSRIISCDGSGDLGGRMTVNSLHYPGYDCPTHRDLPITIGEMGSMYFSTPDNVGQEFGESVLESFHGRLEAVACDAFHNLTGQRKWAAQVCVFNLIWYGLEPLPFNDRALVYEDYTTPGIKPSRITPYLRTLNAGAQEDLPDYIPNPVFEYTKRAYMPVRFFVENAPVAGYCNEAFTFNTAVFNDHRQHETLVLKGRLLSTDGNVLLTLEKTYVLEACTFTDDTHTITLPDIVGKYNFHLAIYIGYDEIYGETLPVSIYDYTTLEREWDSMNVSCISESVEVNSEIDGAAIDCRLLPQYLPFMKKHSVKHVFSNALELADNTLQFNTTQHIHCFDEMLHMNAKPVLFDGLGTPIAISLQDAGVQRILCGIDLADANNEPQLMLLKIALGKLLQGKVAKEPTNVYFLGDAYGNIAAMLDEIRCVYECIDENKVSELLLSKQKAPLIVDGRLSLDWLKGVGNHNFDNIFIMNLEKTPNLFHYEFSVSDKKSFHLQSKQAVDAIGVYGNNLYGLGSGREEVIAVNLLHYNHPSNEIMLGIPNIDWRMWNNNAEYIKTVAIHKGGLVDNSYYSAVSRHEYSGSSIYFSQLTLDTQARKTKNLLTRLLSSIGCAIETTEKNDLDELLYNGIYSNKLNCMLNAEFSEITEPQTLNPGLNRLEKGNVWRIITGKCDMKGASCVFVYSPQDRTDLLLNPDTVDMTVEAVKTVSVYLNGEHKKDGTNFTLTSMTFTAGWNKLILISRESQPMPVIQFKRTNLKKLDLKFGLYDAEVKLQNMQKATITSKDRPHGTENAVIGKETHWQSSTDQHEGIDLCVEFKANICCKAMYFSSQISELRDGSLTPYRFKILAGEGEDLKEVYHSHFEDMMSYPDGKVFIRIDDINASKFQVVLTNNALKPWIVKCLKFLI